MPAQPRKRVSTAPRKPSTRRKAAPLSAEPLADTPRSAMHRPQPSASHQAALFAFAVCAAALLLFAAMRSGVFSPSAEEPAAPVITDPFEQARSSPAFEDWIATWRTQDPYVSAGEFELAMNAPLEERPAMEGTAEVDSSASQRFVWSEYRGRAIDFLAAYDGLVALPFDETSSARAVAYGSAGPMEVAACDGGCTFDAAFWLGEDRAVLLGTQLAGEPGGGVSCPPGTDINDGALNCYRRLTIELLDFAAGTRDSYLSARHVFTSDPFETAKRDRWVAGLTADERAAHDVRASGEALAIEGVITYVDVATGLITVTGPKGQLYAAALSPSVVVHDAFGNATIGSSLRKGQTVAAIAKHEADETLTVVAVKVIK